MNRRVEYIQNTSAREGFPFERGGEWQVCVDQKTKIAYSGFSFMARGKNAQLVLRQDVEEFIMEEEIGEEVRVVAKWNRELQNWPWRRRA